MTQSKGGGSAVVLFLKNNFITSFIGQILKKLEHLFSFFCIKKLEDSDSEFLLPQNPLNNPFWMIPILHKEKSITFKQWVYYAKNKQKNKKTHFAGSSIGDNLPLDKLYLKNTTIYWPVKNP